MAPSPAWVRGKVFRWRQRPTGRKRPPRRRPRPTFVLGLVVALVCALAVRAQEAEDAAADIQATWDFGAIEGGRSYPTQFEVANSSCPGSHTVRIHIHGAPWLRVTSGALIEGLALGETTTPELQLDLRDTEPGNYSGLITIDCITCPPPPACRQILSKLRVKVRVEAPKRSDGKGGCDCAELEQLAETAERKAEAVRKDVERLERELEAAEERLGEAEDALSDARDRRDDLDRYFDESSWIGGDRGRITRGDLELLRDARGEVFDRWKAEEITAEEAVEEWEETDAADLDRLRREKRGEIEDADARLDRARRDARTAEGEQDDARRRLDEARQRADEAQEEAGRARELYEACLADCARMRTELHGLIDERMAEIDELQEDCPEGSSEALDRAIRELESEARRLAEEIPETMGRLDRSFRRMAEALRIHGIGTGIPEEGFTGLWDWGEDLGRAVGRAVGLEEELGTVGKVVSTTAGTVAEGEAGLPVGTDLVAKGVPGSYKVLLAKLDPESPGFLRCLLKAGIPFDEMIAVRSRATESWSALRSGRADRELRRLGDRVERFGGQVDTLRSTLEELRRLEAEEPSPIPGSPPDGASPDELREHEGALRGHRDRLEARCLRLQELRQRLRREIEEARETLREIEALGDRLAKYDRGIRDYLEVHRRTEFDCA